MSVNEMIDIDDYVREQFKLNQYDDLAYRRELLKFDTEQPTFKDCITYLMSKRPVMGDRVFAALMYRIGRNAALTEVQARVDSIWSTDTYTV